MFKHWRIGGIVILLAASILPVSSAFANAGSPAPVAGVQVSRTSFGVNTFSWDSQITTPGAQTALTELGVGMQQFPNSVNWDWQTGLAVNNPQNPVNPNANPESLLGWGKLLQATGETGLYIFSYDQSPGWKGGGTAADAAQLAQYISQHHIPVSAIVIGDEEYGTWDFPWNLHKNKSAQNYAENVIGITKAIRAVLPNVKIGVSWVDGRSPYSLNWDETVLRLDAPYINFLSVHAYPLPNTLSPTQLLQQTPQVIQTLMARAYRQINANVPPNVASRLSVWITEFSPESGPLGISLTPTYGAAMVEALAAWEAAGARRVFVWSFDGGADSPGSPGTFGLTANGQLGSFGQNQLYPSGQAVAELMQAVGAGGTMSAWSGPNGFAASVDSNASASFFINTTDQAQSYSYNNGQSVSVPADSMVRLGQAVTSVSGMSPYEAPSAASNYAPGLPAINSVPNAVYGGQTVTVRGSGFGSQPGYVNLTQGPLNWGASIQNTVEWSAPGNWYTVRVTSWSPNAVTFVVPNNTSAPGGHFYAAPHSGQSVRLSIVTSNQTVSPSIPVGVVPTPAVTVSRVSATVLYPGEWVTLIGSNFGSYGTGTYLHLVDNGVNWGAPGNWYHINIGSWTDNQITFQVPNGLGNTGIALPAGSASLQIVNSAGNVGPLPPLDVIPYGASIQSVSPQALSSGQPVTIAGKGFGITPGYVQITQNGVNWGAPGNAYGIKILAWSPGQVTFEVPDGKNAPGPAVPQGAATVRVVSAGGVSTPPASITVSH